jgi:hypothetical protein
MLNSLLHLRQLMSARDETWGKGAGPLKSGIPVVLRSTISLRWAKVVKMYALAWSAVAPRCLALLNKLSTQPCPVIRPVHPDSLYPLPSLPTPFNCFPLSP